MIRFGLIGGGASPEDAGHLIATWVKPHPSARNPTDRDERRRGADVRFRTGGTRYDPRLNLKATIGVDDAGTITGLAWPFATPIASATW